MYPYDVCLLPSAISEMSAQAARTGKVTLADRYGLMAAILDEKLNYEERRAVNRLLWAIVRGRLKVVSELSTEIVYYSEVSSAFSSKSTQMSASVSQELISNQPVSPPRS
jgi:hypothetical protein